MPPLAIGKAVPLYAIANVPDVVMGEPVTDKNEGTVAATEVTVPLPSPPLAAAVIRPWASTVMLAAVYAPGVTAVFAKSIVPLVVIGPPVKPTPVATEVTVPVPAAIELIVWLGQLPEIVTFDPATKAGVAVPLPPLATGKMPVTPVVRGRPVRLVAVPDDGVPKAPPLVRYEPAGCLPLNVVQSVDVR